jgi:hypothetical protein
MGICGRITLISAIVLSSVSGADYIRGKATTLSDATALPHGRGSETGAVDSASPRLSSLDVAAPDHGDQGLSRETTDTNRQKALALLLLMLKEGRGAR